MIKKPAKRLPFKTSHQQGLSLIEVLIAMALLSVIAIGVLPLFMRSIADRNRGWEATEVSHFAQSELESFLATPYEADALVLETGSDEKITRQVWTEGSDTKFGDPLEGWVSSANATGRGQVRWTRNTYIRWYQLDDLGTPLSGSAKSDVDIKEIQVHITSRRQGGGLGAGQNVWVRVLKAF